MCSIVQPRGSSELLARKNPMLGADCAQRTDHQHWGMCAVAIVMLCQKQNELFLLLSAVFSRLSKFSAQGFCSNSDKQFLYFNGYFLLQLGQERTWTAELHQKLLLVTSQLRERENSCFEETQRAECLEVTINKQKVEINAQKQSMKDEKDCSLSAWEVTGPVDST